MRNRSLMKAVAERLCSLHYNMKVEKELEKHLERGKTFIDSVFDNWMPQSIKKLPKIIEGVKSA